jgi:hypothetical protein
MRELRAHAARERAALPQMEAVAGAAALQRAHLERIASRLPAFLPSLPAAPGDAAAGAGAGAAPAPDALRERAGNGAEGAAPPPRPSAAKPPAAAPVPRRFVTHEEFEAVSSYMRGRLTPDRVNAALEELAAKAEATASLVAAARRGRPLGAQRAHASWLLFNIAGAEALRGRAWALEADLRGGAALRPGGSGKALLTLLRHVGRVTEVRVPAEGATHVVIVLL